MIVGGQFCVSPVFASHDRAQTSGEIGRANPAAAPLDLALPADDALDSVRVAIVVGVSEYRETTQAAEQLTPLPYAANDADLLSQTFRRHGYRVIVLQDFKADRGYIIDTIARLDAPAKSVDSTLVFAFSGHGFQRDGNNYLALGNTDMTRADDTALSVAQVKLALSQTGFKQRVLLIDACRNSPTRADPGFNRRFLPDQSNDGSAIMYSTAGGGLSYEDAELRHGVFSYYVAEGLNGRARNASGTVTFNSLFKFVRNEVSGYVLEAFRRTQTPYVAGERSGDFALVIGPGAANRSNTGQLPPNVVTEPATTQPTTASGQQRWKRVAIGIGVLVVGALLAGASSSGDNGSADDAITLVVPTP